MSAIQNDTEPYIRSDDGATMIALAPGNYVNQAVWNGKQS